MSGIVNLRMLGRFGNQLFQYAFAKAYADKYDCELRNDKWIGEDLFQLPTPKRVKERFKTVRSELDFIEGEQNIELYGYFQSQRAMIYSRSAVRELFKWKPSVDSDLCGHQDKILAHLRRGDYFGYGYPVVSVPSYIRACETFSLNPEDVLFVSEEHPTPGFNPSFVADFYRLSKSPILLRANSSFSWWSAVIADPSQQIYSPVVDGLEGGKEHDVQFVPGNHPRFCNLDFVTDLHLEP